MWSIKDKTIPVFLIAIFFILIGGGTAALAETQLYTVTKKNKSFDTSENSVYTIEAESNGKSIEYEVSKEKYDEIQVGDKIKAGDDKKDKEEKDYYDLTLEIVFIISLITIITAVILSIIL